jgi:hypothetical protein
MHRVCRAHRRSGRLPNTTRRDAAVAEEDNGTLLAAIFLSARDDERNRILGAIAGMAELPKSRRRVGISRRRARTQHLRRRPLCLHFRFERSREISKRNPDMANSVGSCTCTPYMAAAATAACIRLRACGRSNIEAGHKRTGSFWRGSVQATGCVVS